METFLAFFFFGAFVGRVFREPARVSTGFFTWTRLRGTERSIWAFGPLFRAVRLMLSTSPVFQRSSVCNPVRWKVVLVSSGLDDGVSGQRKTVSFGKEYSNSLVHLLSGSGSRTLTVEGSGHNQNNVSRGASLLYRLIRFPFGSSTQSLLTG